MRLEAQYSVRDFAGAFASAFEAQLAGVRDSDRDWTVRFRRTLRVMATGKVREVYPTETEANGYREGEFLYDVIWISPLTNLDGTPLDKPGTGQVELVAESEWGRLHHIAYDFEKLIIAKAPLKFLLYDLGRADDQKLDPILVRTLRRYSSFIEGECYILAGCTWDAVSRNVKLRIRYWQFEGEESLRAIRFQNVWPEDKEFALK